MKYVFSLFLLCFLIGAAGVHAEESYIKVDPLSIDRADYLGKEISTQGTFMRMVEDWPGKGRFYVAETKVAFYYSGGDIFFQLKKMRKGDRLKIRGKVFKYTNSESHYVKVTDIGSAELLTKLYQIMFDELKKRNATADDFYSLANEVDKRNLSVWGGIVSKDLDRLKADILKASLEADPGHEGARKALGYERYKDKWMTSEEIAEEKEAKYAASMRAKGLIEFEGKWMAPDQKMAIQKERERQREERERYVAEQRAKGLVKYKGKWITKEEKEKERADKAISYIKTTKYIYRGASETYVMISILYSYAYENPEFIGLETTPDPANPAATLVTIKFSTTGVPYHILTAPSSQVNYSIKEKMKKAVPLLRITWRINDLTGTITPYNFYAEDALTVYKAGINGLLKIDK